VQLIEAYDTSRTCHRYACKGAREPQGRFECPECGLDDNADKNGALNLDRRAVGTFERLLSEAGYAGTARYAGVSSRWTTTLRTSRYLWTHPSVATPNGCGEYQRSYSAAYFPVT
jgi:transposase